MADLSQSAGEIIRSALRLIQVVASGEQPSDAESADALLTLNQMIDQWNSEELMIFTITISEFPLVPGKQVYTMGPGGDFDVPRPSKIDRMSIISLLNPSQPLELPITMLTDAEWQLIPVKLITSTLPLQCYDDGAYPLRNLNFRYIPQITVNTRIYSWTALQTFPDLVTKFSFPPAYAKAIRYALAVELAPEFGVPLSPVVAEIALESISKIKRMNYVIINLRCDSALVATGDKRIYNWLTDNATGN